MKRTMKKQTFEILPQEERKHLIGLSYNEIGDVMNKKLKAVILDGYTENPGDISWSVIEELVDLTVYPRTAPEEIIERGKDADILIVNKVAIINLIIIVITIDILFHFV